MCRKKFTGSMNRRQKEYKRSFPNQLLLTPADIGDIESSHMNKSFKDNMISAGVCSCLLPLLFLFYGELEEEVRHSPYCVVALMVLCFTAILFYAKFHDRYLKGLKDEIINAALSRADYTGVFLITRRCETNCEGVECDVELLVENDKNKYIPYLDLKRNGCSSEDGELSKENIKKSLAEKLNLGAGYRIIEIDELHSEDSIKSSRKKHNNEVKLMRYVFFGVTFSQNVEKIIKSDRYDWEKLSELEKDTNAWLFNKDVITYIKELFSQDKLPDNSLPPYHQIKIIWNIADTKKCKQSCPICATYSEKAEDVLNREKKALVLCHILSQKNWIEEIDFSGGDPLLEEEDREIILEAISILGNERVCVTTTGKGISKAETDIKESSKLEKLLYKCEISVDIDDEKQACRKEYSSNHQNILTEKKGVINRYVKKLIINVPIINPDIEEEKIKEMINQIFSFPVEEKMVNLIRLMEVGRKEKMKKEALIMYNEQLKQTVEIFCKYAKEQGVEVKLHCALRGLKDLEYKCNLRDGKIGIDSAGNVFSCAWGGYIRDIEKKNNPFYLGNLCEEDLETILVRSFNSYEKIIPAIENRPSRSCCVCSYLHSENQNPYDNSDPLFQNQ